MQRNHGVERERTAIRRLIKSDLYLTGGSATGVNKSVVRSHGLSRRAPISPTYTSSVEQAVLAGEGTPSQRPNPKREIITSAVKNPFAQQAMFLLLGLIDGVPKSRAEIASEMNISGAVVETLIKSGIEDLGRHKKT